MDHNLVIWNTRTSKIVRQYKLPNKIIDDLQWCPDMTKCLLAVCNEEFVFLVAPELYRKDCSNFTKDLFQEASESYKLDVAANEKKQSLCKWRFNLKTKGKKDDKEEKDQQLEKLDSQILVQMEFSTVISRLTWHPRGDYLSTMAHNI